MICVSNTYLYCCTIQSTVEPNILILLEPLSMNIVPESVLAATNTVRKLTSLWSMHANIQLALDYADEKLLALLAILDNLSLYQLSGSPPR